MNEEEKEAIEILKDNIGILEGKLTIKYTNYNTIKAYNTILKLIEKQQKEIKEKNKIINLMAEHIFYNQDDTFPLAYSIKDTKDYFENKAKKR